jgi:hypothetical protein
MGVRRERPVRWIAQREARRLQTAQKAELLAFWRTTLGKPPAFASSRELLAMALAWRLQERQFGGLKPLIERRLRALTDAYKRGKLPAALLLPCSFPPGTQILKLWRGQRHIVTAHEYGFRYRRGSYPSLSAVARAITGATCNGPAFFGLRRSQRASARGESVALAGKAAIAWRVVDPQEWAEKEAEHGDDSLAVRNGSEERESRAASPHSIAPAPPLPGPRPRMSAPVPGRHRTWEHVRNRIAATTTKGLRA